MALFLTEDWIQALDEKLNSDERYAKTARNWEGDFRFVIEPGGSQQETLYFYTDLWHGKCRLACFEKEPLTRKPAFILKAPYPSMIQILMGELDPMTALMTRKLGVQGSLAVMMRNVPTVLDFVRCCREITTGVL